jgi:hypothetical protein
MQTFPKRETRFAAGSRPLRILRKGSEDFFRRNIDLAGKRLVFSFPVKKTPVTGLGL